MSSNLFSHQKPAWLSVILIFAVAMLGFVVIGPLLGFFLSLPFIEGDFFSLQSKLASPMDYPELRIPLFIIQGCATLVGLILIPALYVYAFERKNPIAALLKGKPLFLKTLELTVVVVILFMIPNSFFIQWNAGLSLPGFLKGFENWAREKEDFAAQLTTYLTTFESVPEFLFAFLVIAVLAGIGEELVFRGMLQPELQRATGSIHGAIWLSAILFSAIHLQFFGFVPRMLLGVLFGYLYYWSGHIAVPMLAHFINNGFSVIMVYLYQLGIVGINMETTEAAPLPLVALFTIITFGLLLYLKKFLQQQHTFNP